MSGCFSTSAWSYLQSESHDRAKLRWVATQVPLVLEHNGQDVSPSQSQTAITESINAWNAVSPVKLQPTTQARNKITYSTDERFFGPGVVAVTSLGYSPSTGVVTSGDILINQTSSRGFCLGTNKTSVPCLYLGDVVTHELGHFFGLSHSEVKHSSMMYVAQRGQFSPHADDIAGVRSVYAKSSFGSIAGVVRGGNRIAVFGAHVQAISSRTGGVVASAVSDEHGQFSIDGLSKNDSYFLYVEPLANLQALPDPLRSVKKDFCPGEWVGSFFESCSTSGKGHPQSIRLTESAPQIDVGTVTIRCQLRLGEEYLLGKARQEGGSYSFVATPSRPVQSFVGTYPSETILATDFPSSLGLDDHINLDLSHLPVVGSNPRVEFKLITVPLGSSLDFSIEMDGPSGIVRDTDRVLSSGFGLPSVEAGSLRPIYERRMVYALDSNPALNQFAISLKPRGLRFDESSMMFPSTAGFSVPHRPWLAWITIINDSGVVHEGQLSPWQDNRSCLDAPYTRSVAANPVDTSLTASGVNNDVAAATAPASCATIDPPDSGSGPGAQGFLLTLLGGFLLASLRRFRSS